MNCKPGDIARIVGGDFPENKHRLVSVEEMCTYTSCIDGKTRPMWRCIALQTLVGWWTITRQPKPVLAGQVVMCSDYQLRPLHDGDGEDETLVWAGKPINLAHRAAWERTWDRFMAVYWRDSSVPVPPGQHRMIKRL